MCSPARRFFAPLLFFTPLLCSILPLVAACPAGGGGARGSAGLAADKVGGPTRGFLAQYAATYRFRLGQPRAIRPTPRGDAVLFLRSGARTFVQDLWSYDVAAKRERCLLTAERLLRGGTEKLSAAERARRERERITARGIARYQLSKDGKQLLVPLGRRLFLMDRKSGGLRELGSAEGAPRLDPRLSPDARRLAYVRAGDLYVLELGSGRERRLTHRRGPNIENGLAEFVAQEEMGRFRGYWWSPDSQRLAYQQTDTTGVERLAIADQLHPERPPQRWAYPRSGRKNARVRLGVLGVAGLGVLGVDGGGTRWISWDAQRHPYLAKVVWPKRGPLTLAVQDRRQRELLLLAADPVGGSTRTLHVEHDAAWIELDNQLPRWLPSGRGFLWASERGGYRQLELHGADGKLQRVLTPPALAYRRLADVDEKGGEAVVEGGPPTQQHVYRIDLTGRRSPRVLTHLVGEHGARFSRNHRLWVQRFSGLRERWVALRDRKGGQLARLRSVAEAPPFVPRLELLTVGTRAFNAAVVRPRAFVAGRRYPVIVYVYGGPHYRTVRAVGERYLIQQWIADHGFIVVSIDGRGSPHRGRAWSHALQGSFYKVPLADQVAGLRALGARLPELDLGRVGIFGWSYGGYLTVMAALLAPETYHAAVAGAPVTEWLDYDTHYTERYAGLPAENAAGYRDSSALTHAAKLRRPLLIVHGTADDNVYFFHSIKLARALFLAGRRAELLPLAGFTHVVPDRRVLEQLYARIVGHFQQHLQRAMKK